LLTAQGSQLKAHSSKLIALSSQLRTSMFAHDYNLLSVSLKTPFCFHENNPLLFLFHFLAKACVVAAAHM
jgi:hypothetical protein